MIEKSICCVAGKSGGHIIPCLQFAKKQYLKQNTPLIFISTTAALDKKIVAQFPEITNHLELDLRNVPYGTWWKLPLFAFSFLEATWKSFWYLKKHKPSCIISTGGFVAIPVCLAGKLLGIPISLFELNVIPGKAVGVLTKLATTVFICFKETQSYIKRPCVLTAYPLQFSETSKKITPVDAKLHSGFSENKKLLLILGGSQGSQFLNNLIQKMPLSLLQKYQVVHQTGADHVTECSEFYGRNNVNAQVFAYQDNLAVYYQAADIIICRAGAGTLFEALFFEKQTIVIPLETKITDHQLDNAYAMERMRPDLFSVVRQGELVKEDFFLFF
jgi:UDP-N-acetylglucosamine--N-acetylmuramyl-(pentapeptide) pyrophosphoryl-undecaprenol N-acetylglucosamine transferase